MPLIPVLEVGGTHVSSALIASATWTLCGPAARLALDADGSADELLAVLAAATDAVAPPPGVAWGVAMPDPFDYARGIALFHGVGKFDALHGVPVGAVLGAHVGAAVHFVNDADAFALGEWVHGAGSGSTRCAGITLGTGIGSGWVVAGHVVDDGPGVPPGGRIHRLRVDGAPLEDAVSRRAIRTAYAGVSGNDRADVREIAELARGGDATATGVLRAAFSTLGRAVGPAVLAFGAEVLVVGGSMAASWELFEPWFRGGAGPTLPPIRVARNAAEAPLIGAAYHVSASRSR